MPIQPFTFGVESRPGRFGPDGGAILENVFVEEADRDSRTPYNLYCRPGLKNFVDVGGAETGLRGSLTLETEFFPIVGRQLHRIDLSGAVLNSYGFPGTGFAWMRRNAKVASPQIAVASEGLRYLWEADAFNAISDTDLPAAVAVLQLGHYFIWLLTDGSYQISSLLEGGQYDAADFATAEANPDGLVGGAEYGQTIMLAGSQSVEFHANTGASDFPFERIDGTTLTIGCLAGPTIVSAQSGPVFVASDATVRRMSGYLPVKISNQDVVNDIDALADKGELRADIMTIRGHEFYVLSSLSWTWVCDLTTNFWSKWKTGVLDRFLGQGFMKIGDKRIVGGYNTTKLYELDMDTFDDAGEHLIWKLISGAIGTYPHRIIADEIYCNLLPGVGLNTTDPHEQNPEAMLRVSLDDGNSWSDEMRAPVGKIGEKNAEASFDGLGECDEDGFRFELSMSAAVARGLTDSSIRYEPLEP